MSEATQIPYKIYLNESEMPTKWHNVRAARKKKPAPLLNPGTHEPMAFDELRPVFCDELIKQEHALEIQARAKNRDYSR